MSFKSSILDDSYFVVGILDHFAFDERKYHLGYVVVGFDCAVLPFIGLYFCP